MNEIRLYMSLDLKTVYTRIQYNMTNIFLHTVKAEIYIIMYNFFVLEISFNNESNAQRNLYQVTCIVWLSFTRNEIR